MTGVSKDIVERLVELCRSRLASYHLIDDDDIRQEIAIIYLQCLKRYRPEVGPFENYFTTRVRHWFIQYPHDHHQIIMEPLKETPCVAKENIEEYLPLPYLTQGEQEILLDYLEGYTFDEIERRNHISRDSAKNMFKEIVLKIQEANEKN